MTSTLPVIEIMYFRPNRKCLDDPGLFKEVRDMVVASTMVRDMYWGRSVETPLFFYWLLLWDSFAQSTMGVGTPSHAKLVSKLDALVDEPSIKRVYHVNFSEHPPLSCIEAPVTVIAIAVLKDIQYLDAWRRAGESARSNLSAAFPGKLLKSAHGSPLEDVQTMVYFAGWESIEAHMGIGTEERHQKAVKETEEYFSYLKELHLHHVHFERHG